MITRPDTMPQDKFDAIDLADLLYIGNFDPLISVSSSRAPSRESESKPVGDQVRRFK